MAHVIATLAIVNQQLKQELHVIAKTVVLVIAVIVTAVPVIAARVAANVIQLNAAK